MKIFYSWQLDADRKINKDFIHDALSDAVVSINSGIDLSEAERPEVPLTLDQDTKGVLGSPSIAETIFNKISLSDVVVLDVSLVAKGQGEKLHINSNVAIELGFAIGKCGSEPILKVMNTYFGDFDGLPFDLRDRRRPVAYCLSPTAEQGEIARVKMNLVKELQTILRAYLHQLTIEPPKAHMKHEPTQPSYVETAFWTKGSTLGKRHRTEESVFCHSSRLMSIRVIPEMYQEPLSQLQCREGLDRFPPMLDYGGSSLIGNNWGALSYYLDHQSTSIISGTQLLKNCEVWMFTTDLFSQRNADDADPAKWFLTNQMLMLHLPLAIENALELSKKVSKGPSQLRVTASSLSDVSVVITDRFGRRTSEISEITVEIRRPVKPSLDAGSVAFEFTEKIYAEAGVKLHPQ